MNDHGSQLLFDRVLGRAVRLFQDCGLSRDVGREYSHPSSQDNKKDSPPKRTALVGNGLCLWAEALRNPTADPAGIATIHVTPGQIFYKGSNYVSIWDVSNDYDKFIYSMDMPPIVLWDHPSTSLKEESTQAYHALYVVAEERRASGTIKLAYLVDDNTFRRPLQPGMLTEQIFAATARVPCPRAATCSNELTTPCWQLESGWHLEKNVTDSLTTCPASREIVACIWNASSPLSKLLALEGCRAPLYDNIYVKCSKSGVIMRSQQCLACITRYLTTFRSQAEWEYKLYTSTRDPPRPGRSDMAVDKYIFHII